MRLQAWARRTGRSVSEVGARSIEEWLRQGEFAEIEFRGLAGERHACLKGGPPVWQIIQVAREYDLDADRTAAHFGWPPHRVRAALNYYEAYPEEVDRAVEDNLAVTYDQLKRVVPRAERLVVSELAVGEDTPG